MSFSDSGDAVITSDSAVTTSEKSADENSAKNSETVENSFHSLGLSEPLLALLDKSGYVTPTPIQAQTIPLLLEGKDVLGQAQTGTGKTAAFALPLLDRIDLSKKNPQVLVLTPTRELAIQVAEAFQKYATNMRGLNIIPIYGGQDYQIQLRPLKRGVHIVVGTPGRVMDHIRRGSLKLDGLQCLVLDEADEMLRMGFAEDVDWISSHVPDNRQRALFSATMPKQIRQIAQKHLHDPSEIIIKQKTATADTIHQRYIVSSAHQKQNVLVRILEAEQTDGIIIFVKTKRMTDVVSDHLKDNGFRSSSLNGDIVQKQRERIVDSLRGGKIDIIVATDVAARGLDVKRISHVINYDLPHDSESYVHRIGRTGRAGRTGNAILFLHPNERRMLTQLEQATRQKIEAMELPSNRAINKKRVTRFHEQITETISKVNLEQYQSVIEHYHRESDVPLEVIAAALASMVHTDSPLLIKDEIKQAKLSDKMSYDRDRGGSRKRDNRSGRNSSSPRRAEAGMETYRIEVGRTHRVQPGNIVGAIANESGIGSDMIGRIQILDRYSTVDLPEGLQAGALDSLKNVYVAGRKLQISRMDKSQPRPARSQPAKRRFNKPKSNFRK